MVDFGHRVMSSGTSSDEEYEEHNVKNFSLEVVGQGWSGGLVHLFLEDWVRAWVALSCHWASDLLVSGNARRLEALILLLLLPLLQCF